MKQYRVEITDRALKDLEEIYTYIADQLQPLCLIAKLIACFAC